MRNTIADLNNYLFEALERINDDELDERALETLERILADLAHVPVSRRGLRCPAQGPGDRRRIRCPSRPRADSRRSACIRCRRQ